MFVEDIFRGSSLQLRFIGASRKRKTKSTTLPQSLQALE